MRFSRLFTTIDTHTEGEPTRTIIGGIPWIPGDTMADKMLYLKENRDWIRRILMNEPRGHGVMSGAILTQPTVPEADMGVIYIEVGGYLAMCGHDTIGCCTAMIEAGIIEARSPRQEIVLETPAGIVRAQVEVDDLRAKSVTFENVPGFVYKRDAVVKVDGLGEITVDIVYGGLFYAIVAAEAVGLEICAGQAAEIIRTANLIKDAVNKQYRVVHPSKPFLDYCSHVEFTGPSTIPGLAAKNAVVFPPGSIDRSPCGTGTSAKLALMYERGEIGIGETLVHESIIGTTFSARILRETEVYGYRGIVPEVTGRAYVTGFHTFVFDPDDPLTDGFLLGS